MDAVNMVRPGLGSIEQISDTYLGKRVKENTSKSEISFDDILRQKEEALHPVKFSKHALNRLSERDIDLSESQRSRLFEGVNKANEKGIKESLVLVDSLAFIVNVPNKTVVTAMDSNSNDNIFTNIDGAVIV